jgi:hypothetical protein
MKMYLLIKHHTMTTYWGSGGIALLTSAVDGGEWLASCTSQFTPRIRAPSTYSIRVGPRVGLDAVVKRKNPVTAPARN